MPLSWVRNPFVVQTIDTTAFLSSDPAGLTYIPGSEPGTGRIILVDSEIDERPFYKLNNMFTLTESGEFVGATNLVSGVTREPTGIAYSADANLLFITDDDQHTISIVSATNPSVRLGSIDVSAISSDTEDPFFDNSSGHLFFLEGGTGINRRTIFELHDHGADNRFSCNAEEGWRCRGDGLRRLAQCVLCRRGDFAEYLCRFA